MGKNPALYYTLIWSHHNIMKCHYILLIFVLSVVTGIHARHRAAGDQKCVNMWDEGCINGQLPGSGGDDDYLNGGFNPGKRCVNMWDEGCVNGQLNGAGGDDGYLNGGFNPGKRCVNVWDEGCINGQLHGAGGDDDYLHGGFNPGKRTLQAWLLQNSKMHKLDSH